MKLLVTGAGGMLGADVTALGRALGHDVEALTHADLDIAELSQVEREIGRAQPEIVINCAAWTDVDGAESSESAADRVNAIGPGLVAEATAEIGATVMHLSTDYVFDGTKQGAYYESDSTNPIQAYGRGKLKGEQAVARANHKHFIVRSSWLFGLAGPNFVETMLRLGRNPRKPLMVVTDQVGCPTYTGHLAAGLLRLAESKTYGVHHVSGGGKASWYEFATEIFRLFRIDHTVTPTTTDQFPRPAARPANSVLTSQHGVPTVLPDWKLGLAEYADTRR